MINPEHEYVRRYWIGKSPTVKKAVEEWYEGVRRQLEAIHIYIESGFTGSTELISKTTTESELASKHGITATALRIHFKKIREDSILYNYYVPEELRFS